MTRFLIHPFLAFAACVIGLSTWGIPSTATAQAAPPRSVSTCNLKGTLTVTIAGFPSTTTDIGCINKTERTTPGDSGHQEVAALNLPLGLGALGTLRGRSIWKQIPTLLDPDYTAETTAGDISLFQNAIQIKNVEGELNCDLALVDDTAKCMVLTGVGGIIVAGVAVSTPPQPIPVNFEISVPVFSLPVSVLGVTINVPVNGKIILNKVTLSGIGTPSAKIEHAPLAIQLSGAIVAPVAGVSVTLDLQVYGQWTAGLSLSKIVVTN